MDYASLWANGLCRVCGQPAYAEPAAFHGEQHIQTGEAVVMSGRVVPTASVPIGNGWANLWDYGDGETTYQLRGPDWDALRAAYARQRTTRKAG